MTAPSRHGSSTPQAVVVVGAGAAGLATALKLAPLPVLVLSAGPILADRPGAGSAATGWAQGGIAAAIDADDHPGLHAADTIAAGAGLVDPAMAARITAAAPACIDWLMAIGTRFDSDASGRPTPGLEAAHSRPRILHAGGDATGHAILSALLARTRATPSIQIIEHARATALYRDAAGGIAGLGVIIAGRPATIATPAVVLATGGIGGLYAATTNPPGATGSGLALAAGLGARLRDLEFVQMHPTAIDIGRDPMPLASEALRGAGAVLIDDRGHRLMAGVDGGDLAPRDVVARAVAAATARGRGVFLDGTEAIGRDFARRFPNAHAACVAVGLDPVRQPIPVAAAAHYHMGGIAVDDRGRTSIDGLWAVGEVAATGLHGANRLASNSLLEALVCGGWAAEDIAGRLPAHQPPGAMEAPASAPIGAPTCRSRMIARTLRRMMTATTGVIRDRDGLDRMIAQADAVIDDPTLPGTLRDRALVCRLIAEAARDRPASVGAHYRRDSGADDDSVPDDNATAWQPPLERSAIVSQPAHP